MERYLKIENYRNIGVDEPQKFNINSFIEFDQLGDLIIVVGQNNTGKSNILSAFNSFNNGISNSDNPDFIYDNINSISPQISLIVKDNNVQYSYIKRKSETIYKYKDTEVNSIDFTNNDFNILNQVVGNADLGYSYDYKNVYDSIKESIDKKDIIDTNVYNILKSKIDTNNVLPKESLSELNKKIDKYLKCFSCDESIVTKQFKEKYNFLLNPKIIEYKQEQITQNSLNCSISNLKNSVFYPKLFKILNVETEDVYNFYAKYKQENVFAHIRNFERDLQKKLDKITQKFNKTYCYEKNLYDFTISLERDSIHFSICQKNLKNTNSINDNNLPLNLDKQSTGFKWFFNFYFNVIAHDNLSKGDIILMDEPATNLHPSAALEWRRIVKEYATNSGITIILATHNPFLIDIDYLEELRILKKIDKHVQINNYFTMVENECDDKDILGETLKALTIPMHIIRNPQNTLIFVEGVTDYNYLTAFKKYFKIENIDFMPFNGVKDKNLGKKLKKIIRNPIVLLDGDNAGLKQADVLKKEKEIEVFVLSEIDKDFKEIESLFVGNFSNYIKEKSFNYSSLIKRNLKPDTFSKETFNNFKKVLDQLSL